MAVRQGLYVLSLVVLAAASRLQARAPAFCSAGEASREASCISAAGTPFVSSFCALYTPLVTSEVTVDRTTTVTSTITTGTTTQFSTPPATATVFSTNDTQTTITSGRSTTYLATITDYSTSLSSVYTCGTATVQAQKKNRRQAQSPALTPPLSPATPTCLTSFQAASGTVGFRSACDCLVSAPTGTTVVTDTNFIIATVNSSVLATAFVLPTVTATLVNTTSRTVTRYVTSTATVPNVIPAIFTVTSTVTSITYLPSPTPSSFYLYYNDSSSGETYYAAYVNSPGSTGTLIGLSRTTPGDSFTLDANSALIDLSDQGTIAAKNTQDIWPLLYLNPTPAAVGNTPACSICGGGVVCNYPGSALPSEFALCTSQKFLSLGAAGPWASNGTDGANGTCTVVNLGIEAIAAAQPTPYGRIGITAK